MNYDRKVILFTALILLSILPVTVWGQTRWRGTVSTSWRNSANWTNGIPTASVDAIIGDAAFTGPYQPYISASASCKSLTLVSGAKNPVLTIARSLTVNGTLTINSGCTISHRGVTLTVKGDWINNGTYSTTSTSSIVTMSGTTQSIGGTSANAFRRLTIGAGSTVTQNVNISTSVAFVVNGTFIPAENATPRLVSGAGPLTVSATGILHVKASTFNANYGMTTINLNAGSTVDYSATLANQTIRNNLTYSTLRVSGALVKTLGGNLNTLNSSTSTAGRIDVTSGTLDLSTFTANRGTSVAGGSINVANGAILRIGGTNTFPLNYATHSLSLTSTVEYYGLAQTVTPETYGNLTLSSSSGAVVKTMPSTAFTVFGNFSSTVGSGTGVSYTAAANIFIDGNVNIGAATTFNGGSFTHEVDGNWVNNGTFTGATSTMNFGGPGSSLSGTGVHNFNNVNFLVTNITAAANTNITVSGNLATINPGTFTHLSGGTLTMTGSSKTISGTNFIVDNLTISGTISTTSSILVNGNLTVSGSFNATGGTVTMPGAAKIISGAGAIAFGALFISGTVTTTSSFSIGATLDIGGTFSASAGTATFTSTSTLNGTANLFNVVLNGTSLQLATDAVLGIAGAFTVTAGILNISSAVPNTVNFNGTVAQNVNALTYNRLLLSGASTKTAAGAITAVNFTVSAGTTFTAGAFNHQILEHFVNNGTFNAGSGTVTFTGSNLSTITGTTTFNVLALNKNTMTTHVDLASSITAVTLNMTSGAMNTGSNIITITATRAGNGIILGNIRRQHAFSAGTPYAFESPNNTLTPGTSATGIITVSAVVGPVNDFPQGASINRLYTITTGLALGTSTLRLHYEDAEVSGSDESSITLWRNNGTTWSLTGKTANSTTANYVEQSGLSAVTGSWTLSDNSNVVRWNGSVSSDWSAAANWTSVEGAPSLPPGVNDIAEIGTAAFTNQPVINNAVSVKSITLGSAQPVTLTVAAGGSLSTQGNIRGAWSANATHTINVGGQTLTVNGDLALSDGTSGHAINLTIGTGIVTVTGSVTQSGAANVNFTGAGSLSIGSNYNYTSGTFTPGTSTLTYNGAGAQIVAALPYYHLQINKAGGNAVVSGATTVAGNLNVTQGTLNLNGNTTVTGAVNISPGATISSGTTTITAGGNWNNSGSFIPSGGTVILNGAGTQTLSGTTFNNLTIAKPGTTVTLTGNIILNGNLTLSTGIFNLSTFTANRSSAGGTFTISDGSTLQTAGADNLPAGFSTYTISTTSTTHYNGTVAQAVAGVAYGNLILSGGGTKTLTGTCTVGGNLTINSGATFNGGAYTINLSGNWINNGTFVPGSGTVTMNGAAKTISGNTNFNRVTIYGSYAVSGSDITYDGLLVIASSGSFDGGSGTATINGDLTNNGSLVSNGVTIFSGTRLQTIRFVNAVVSNSSGVITFNGTVSPILNSTSPPTYATLNVNNTGGVNASVGWRVFVAFNIGSGASFNGGPSTHIIYGSFTNNGTVTSSGTMDFSPTAPQTIKLSGTGFSSTGTVIFNGTGASTITGTPTALNNVVIGNSGGVTPSSNWSIGGNFVISDSAIFNAGTYNYTVAEHIESHGTLNGGTSTFTMTSTAGRLFGSTGTTFYDLVNTGNVEVLSDFNVSRNFTNNGTFDATVGALAMTGSLPSLITGSAASFDLAQLTIHKAPAATTSLGKAITAVEDLTITTGTLDAAGFAITPSATEASLTIEDNARLIMRGTFSLPAFTEYALDTLSTVEYGGSTQAISTATNYGNLVISAAGTKTASAALHILNDFTLSNGTFVPGSFTDTIGGNWTMTGGTYTNTGSTAYFNGTGLQTITSTGAFNNITVNKPSEIISLGSNITVNGVLNFILNKIRTGSTYAVILPATGSVTGASQSTGWVYGRLQKAVPTGNVTRTFETGDSLYYTPATVTIPSVTTAGNLLAGVTAADHPNINSSTLNAGRSLNRYWSFTNTGIAFSTATTTLNWNATDVDAGANTANFKVASYNGTSWTTPTTVDPQPTSIQATGLTSLNLALAVGEITGENTWTGAVSVNWFVTGNWSANAIPVNTTNVIIPTGVTNYPTVGTGTATTANLTIQTGASLTVNAGTLQIYGAIVNNGTFTATNGTIEMSGSTAQAIPAGTFTGNTILNLTVNNTAGVTLGGALNAAGIVKVTTGQLQSAGNLTLLSTATGTALIDGSGSGSVLGNVTMQRYRPTGFGYIYFSSPFQSATVNEFADDINLSATFPTFYRYVENRASSGWTAYTATSGALTPMVGYAGNLGTSTSPVTIDMTGVVNNGTVTAPTLTNNNQPYTLGFNLVGNPYPSPVDWDATGGWTRTNVDNAIYYFNTSTTDRYTGTYSSYINGISSDGVATNIIPAMQGFFVHVTNGSFPVSGTLAVNNTARVNNLTPSFHRERPLTEPLLRLGAGFTDDGHPSDPAVIYFDNKALPDFEQELDALKIQNTDPAVPNLYVMAGNQKLSIAAWPDDIDSSTTIPLGLTTEREGYISFTMPTLERMQAGRHFYLYDKEADLTHDLHGTTPYRLFLSKGVYEKRFFLVLQRGDNTPSGDAAYYHAYTTGNNLYGQFDKVPGEKCVISVTSLSGQVLLRKDFTGNGRYLLGSQYSSGIYIVTFFANRQQVSKKVFISNQ